uniref:Uncharacterized protein n=1 Tax=Zea mays TaxID=4577 RepID=A0A804M2U0_MAIZE
MSTARAQGSHQRRPEPPRVARGRLRHRRKPRPPPGVLFNHLQPALLLLIDVDACLLGVAPHCLRCHARAALLTGTKFGHGVDGIKEWILPKLPLGTAYYPKFGATNPLDNKDKSGAKSSFSPSSMTKKV